jgi:hypothetical protein
LSEYLVFQYILQSIEYRTGSKFSIKELTKDITTFDSSEFLLIHGADIRKIDPRVNTDYAQRTDIALLKKGQNSDWELLAAFELKVYITDRNVMRELIKRLSALGETTKAFLFPVLFQEKNSTAKNWVSFAIDTRSALS